MHRLPSPLVDLHASHQDNHHHSLLGFPQVSQLVNPPCFLLDSLVVNHLGNLLLSPRVSRRHNQVRNPQGSPRDSLLLSRLLCRLGSQQGNQARNHLGSPVLYLVDNLRNNRRCNQLVNHQIVQPDSRQVNLQDNPLLSQLRTLLLHRPCNQPHILLGNQAFSPVHPLQDSLRANHRGLPQVNPPVSQLEDPQLNRLLNLLGSHQRSLLGSLLPSRRINQVDSLLLSHQDLLLICPLDNRRISPR